MSGVTHVVVDGSNIATEGRTTPSLAQLEQAVDELRIEMPDAEVIVVVDATFAHRIEGAERQRFEAAALQGAYVYPPAGAIGRGDAFLLRIAQKIGATVLSNDSFQEFHGEHEWLFDKGRLFGATPVPGVGWIFVPRTPVRGPKSRIAVRDAGRERSKVEKAIAVATREAVAPDAPKGRRKRKKKGEAGAGADGDRDGDRDGDGDGDGAGAGGRRAPRAVNDPLTFISFVADHPLGSVLEGEVEEFTSHGAVVLVDEMHCYVPLSGLGDPPPRGAREVLRRDERRSFVLTALDPQRRGVELALPEVAVVSGRPTEETVEADVALTRVTVGRRAKQPAETAPEPAPPVPAPSPPLPAPAPEPSKPSRRHRAAAASEPAPAAVPAPEPAPEPPAPEPSKPARRRRGAAAAAAEPAGPPEPVAPAPVAPAPRRSRRGAAAAEPATALEPPEPDPTKPPRRRRGAVAAADPVAAPEPREPGSTKSPRRGRTSVATAELSAAAEPAPERGPSGSRRSRKRTELALAPPVEPSAPTARRRARTTAEPAAAAAPSSKPSGRRKSIVRQAP